MLRMFKHVQLYMCKKQSLTCVLKHFQGTYQKPIQFDLRNDNSCMEGKNKLRTYRLYRNQGKDEETGCEHVENV